MSVKTRIKYIIMRDFFEKIKITEEMEEEFDRHKRNLNAYVIRVLNSHELPHVVMHRMHPTVYSHLRIHWKGKEQVMRIYNEYEADESHVKSAIAFRMLVSE